MRASLVIETWNLGSARGTPKPVEQALRLLLGALSAQTRPLAALADLVITHDGLPEPAQARLDAAAGRPIVWVEVPQGSDYYHHKNEGFDASTGEIVAFTDGDCAPAPRWLESLLTPMERGQARVVAGRTYYPDGAASLAGTVLDFPQFSSPLALGAVRNFFANNVAFERALFASRRYPAIPGMFHGQCQVLALTLQRDGVVIQGAPDAVVTHAWPEGASELLRMRLLRGADVRSFTPYMVRAYAPWLAPSFARLGLLGVWAVLIMRAARASALLLDARPAPRQLAAGMGMIAAASLIDSAGALAASAVYRRYL